MKQSDIAPGVAYSDKKLGVREVVSISGGGNSVVTYRLLAAKVTEEYSWLQGTTVSLIGATFSMTLAAFAAWAEESLPGDALALRLAQLKAQAIKLSPGELAYMQDAMQEAGGAITAGTLIQFDHTEGRAVSGLAKKGLVERLDGEALVTELGAAWFGIKSVVQP